MSLSGVEVAVVVDILFVAGHAVGAVGIVGIVLAVVFGFCYDALCQGDSLGGTLEVVEGVDLALEGDDAGVGFVEMALADKGGDDAVEFGEAFLLFAYLREYQTDLGFRA